MYFKFFKRTLCLFICSGRYPKYINTDTQCRICNLELKYLMFRVMPQGWRDVDTTGSISSFQWKHLSMLLTVREGPSFHSNCPLENVNWESFGHSAFTSIEPNVWILSLERTWSGAHDGIQEDIESWTTTSREGGPPPSVVLKRNAQVSMMPAQKIRSPPIWHISCAGDSFLGLQLNFTCSSWFFGILNLFGGFCLPLIFLQSPLLPQPANKKTKTESQKPKRQKPKAAKGYNK